MSQMNLSYSGQIEVAQNITQQSKDLLEALLEADSANTPLSVDIGQVRPRGDTAVLIVSLSAQGDISTLQTAQDALASDVVALGLEESVEDAKDAISITQL